MQCLYAQMVVSSRTQVATDPGKYLHYGLVPDKRIPQVKRKEVKQQASYYMMVVVWNKVGEKTEDANVFLFVNGK